MLGKHVDDDEPEPDDQEHEQIIRTSSSGVAIILDTNGEDNDFDGKPAAAIDSKRRQLAEADEIRSVSTLYGALNSRSAAKPPQNNNKISAMMATKMKTATSEAKKRTEVRK